MLKWHQHWHLQEKISHYAPNNISIHVMGRCFTPVIIPMRNDRNKNHEWAKLLWNCRRHIRDTTCNAAALLWERERRETEQLQSFIQQNNKIHRRNESEVTRGFAGSSIILLKQSLCYDNVHKFKFSLLLLAWQNTQCMCSGDLGNKALGANHLKQWGVKPNIYNAAIQWLFHFPVHSVKLFSGQSMGGLSNKALWCS